MKPVIICVATTPRFQEGMERLRKSCHHHWDGDLLLHKTWPTPKGIKSYTQDQMPYQFKIAAIQEALEAGYTKIIWLDSTMQLLKNPLPLLENSKTGIVTFHNLGHPLWRYISDDALTRLEIMLYGVDIKEVPQLFGGAFMIDFDKDKAGMSYEVLKACSLDGSFKNGGSKREGFVAHRHDQAVMSIVFYGYCDMLPYGYIVSQEHLKSGEYGNDNYILYQGI